MGGGGVFTSSRGHYPATLEQIDQALCRRKCPAEGWTGGLWCTKRRPGQQEEEKKEEKSAGLLKSVSEFFSLSPSASPVCSTEGENVAPPLTQLSPALPFTSWPLVAGCSCTSSGLPLHVRAPRAALCPPSRLCTAAVRTRQDGERGFDPSVIDARACQRGLVFHPGAHTRMYRRMRSLSILPLSLGLSRVKSVRKFGRGDKRDAGSCDSVTFLRSRRHASPCSPRLPVQAGIWILSRLLRICALCPFQRLSWPH